MVTTKIKTKSPGTSGKSKNSPKWEGHENWTADQFSRHFSDSMSYYRLEFANKDFKPFVLKWMRLNDFTDNQIDLAKKFKDYRFGGTLGGIATALITGVPAVREDFNNGKNTAEWLKTQITEMLEKGKDDIATDAEEVESAAKVVINIQERLQEVAARMTEDIDLAIDSFILDPESFDPKAFKIINMLKGKQAKAAHARIIKDFYKGNYEELTDAVAGRCEQLSEAYGHFNKRQLRKLFDFYQDILNSCEMIMQEAKVNKKPRAKKSVSADKLVSKLKFCKTDDQFKLVSINPAEVVGSKELWVFNRKTRKLGKYLADDYRDLTVKGTSIVGFNANTSVQKTLRKPLDQLKEFKDAGKVQLRKFLEDIKATEIKLNGRINEDVVLLKTAK